MLSPFFLISSTWPSAIFPQPSNVSLLQQFASNPNVKSVGGGSNYWEALHMNEDDPLFKDPKAEFRKDWLYEYYEYPDSHKVKPHRGVRTEQWKLIHYYETPEEFELYDLEKDPWEKENLYGRAEHADRAKQLQQRLEELRRETGDR